MFYFRVGWMIGAVALLAACDGGEGPSPEPPVTPTRESTTSTPTPSPTPPVTPTPTPEPEPAEFDADAAMETIEHLADQIGPREATSDAFHEAANDVERWFTELGYEVRQVSVPVPAGNSWGVDVPEGESANVIADPPGFTPTAPHVIIGAHLDTVPQAPGAEDNASGVAVLMELARMAAVEPPPIPVRFVAFGAEEPRGEGDASHHFGSQQYVADMPENEQDALVAMVSLDRVGVRSDEVPICTGGTGTTDVRNALVAAANAIDVPAQTCENRASDHWSFEKADLPAARLGSVPFAGYHSPDDVPAVIDTRQLDRVGRIVWAWLGAP